METESKWDLLEGPGSTWLWKLRSLKISGQQAGKPEKLMCSSNADVCQDQVWEPGELRCKSWSNNQVTQCHVAAWMGLGENGYRYMKGWVLHCLLNCLALLIGYTPAYIIKKKKKKKSRWAQNQEKLMFQSPGSNPAMSQLSSRQKDTYDSSFCSIQSSSWLDKAHPHWASQVVRNPPVNTGT